MGAPVSIPRRLLSVDEYYQLGHAGVLKEEDRIELIEGEMIEMAPIGGPHVFAVNQFTRLFSYQLGDAGVLSIQNPVLMPPRNAPQPDIAILAPSTRTSKALPTAQDVLLLIEVAHTTVDYDRDVKIPIYAHYGIEESWLWNIEAQTLSIYLEPGPKGYQRLLSPGKHETVSASRLPMIKIPLSELL